MRLHSIVILLAAAPALASTYYVAPDGLDSNAGTLASPWQTIGKAANTLVAGDTVFIRNGTYREQVSPANSGSPGAWITYVAYPGERPAIDGTGVVLSRERSGLISIVGRSYIRIERLLVTNSGPNVENAGIDVEQSSDIVIADNLTYDTHSSGIGVWSSRNVTVTGNDIRLACHYDGFEACITIGDTENFEVMNNVIHDGSPDPIGGEGIFIKGASSHGSVHDNDIRELIVNPSIYIDSWEGHAFDIRVFRNVIHDNWMSGIALASEAGGLLEDVVITNNIVYHCGSHGIILGGWSHQIPAHPVHDIRIINNTISNCGAATAAGGILIDNPDAQDVIIRNNIVSGNYAFQIASNFSIPGLTIDHNLIDGYRGFEAEMLGTDVWQGDPLFRNAGAGDFRLHRGSPAIDRGSPLDAPPDDFARMPRPQGAAIDIGAFEYPAAPPRRRVAGH